MRVGFQVEEPYMLPGVITDHSLLSHIVGAVQLTPYINAEKIIYHSAQNILYYNTGCQISYSGLSAHRFYTAAEIILYVALDVTRV